MARPTKLTESRARNICSALAAGATRKQAAALAGVCFMSFLRWRAQSPDFDMRVRTAEAEAEITATRALMAAADGGDWEAALFWLERRHPEDWGRR